jgi:hypothetical protein
MVFRNPVVGSRGIDRPANTCQSGHDIGAIRFGCTGQTPINCLFRPSVRLCPVDNAAAGGASGVFGSPEGVLRPARGARFSRGKRSVVVAIRALCDGFVVHRATN